MEELMREYQRRMDWSDAEVISILCDYLEDSAPHQGSFQDWLGLRMLEDKKRNAGCVWWGE